jgi:tRNA(Ile)-lysidine synthase
VPGLTHSSRPAAAAPAIDLPARLAAALGRPPARDETLAVAVSGGPDSVALLRLAAAAWPGRIHALTVDHGLRAAAAGETAALAARCAAAGIPHATLHWRGGKPGSGVQAAARAARYALLAQWCDGHRVGVLMTAHHADDQAETLLMRLARGAGSAGLAGIRRCRPLAPGVTLVRPLLGIRRRSLAEIAAAAATEGWPIVDDPANRDPRHRRSAARALLAATPWLDAAAMAQAAAHLADTDAALDWAAAGAWAGRAAVVETGIVLDAAGLPAAIVHRLVERSIAALMPEAAPRGPDVARLARRLGSGGTGTLAGVRAQALADGDWRFSKAPARRDSRDITS